jgi:hypothetical protein
MRALVRLIEGVADIVRIFRIQPGCLETQKIEKRRELFVSGTIIA